MLEKSNPLPGINRPRETHPLWMVMSRGVCLEDYQQNRRIQS